MIQNGLYGQVLCLPLTWSKVMNIKFVQGTQFRSCIPNQ